MVGHFLLIVSGFEIRNLIFFFSTEVVHVAAADQEAHEVANIPATLEDQVQPKVELHVHAVVAHPTTLALIQIKRRRKMFLV